MEREREAGRGGGEKVERGGARYKGGGSISYLEEEEKAWIGNCEGGFVNMGWAEGFFPHGCRSSIASKTVSVSAEVSA